MVEKIDWAQIDWVKMAKEDPKTLALLEGVACKPCEEDAGAPREGPDVKENAAEGVLSQVNYHGSKGWDS